MQIGISTYCLERELKKGNITLGGAVDWAARAGAECLELVPGSFRLADEADGRPDAAAVAALKRRAKDAGVTLCNYSISANFCREGAEWTAEVERVRRQIDIVSALEIPLMRHDVSAWNHPAGNTAAEFDRWLPAMAEAARTLAEYARDKGVTTLVENHGYFMNGTDRVERLLRTVEHPNYGFLLDVGNFACVDEDAAAAARALSGQARMVHLKDFYLRRADPGDAPEIESPGRWLRSRGGLYLRGAILHQGDLDIPSIFAALKAAGYDGCMALEFEGMEDARYATAVGLRNARRLWDK